MTRLALRRPMNRVKVPSREEVGGREQSFRLGCAAKYVSGSSHSSSTQQKMYSPLEGIAGQYIS